MTEIPGVEQRRETGFRPAPRHDRRADYQPPPAVAAIDLGTNNCRLLVARPAPGGFRVIDAFSRIVRLGEGVGRTGLLCDGAVDRTIAALRVCAGKMARRRVTLNRAVATEACRRAGNFMQFQERVRDETGVTLEMISAEEEARLALAGCAPLLDPRVSHALVFDIGGGSTELMWLAVSCGGRPSRLIELVSLPLGVVTLSERHGGDAVSAEAYEAMVADALERMAPLEARRGIAARVARGEVQMLGSSGTVTTLAGVFRKLPRYDRSVVDGTFLDFSAARSVSDDLRAMDYEGRAAHPCIGRDRADLVVAGCAILEAICRLWPVGRLRIADRGVREGILLDLIARLP